MCAKKTLWKNLLLLVCVKSEDDITPAAILLTRRAKLIFNIKFLTENLGDFLGGKVNCTVRVGLESLSFLLRIKHEFFVRM